MATEDDGTPKYDGDSKVCGFCRKAMKGNNKESWNFQKCDLCQIVHPLHPKCAAKLWKDISLKETNKIPVFDKDVFIGKKSVGLLCVECNRKCFYCDVNHNTGGKL